MAEGRGDLVEWLEGRNAIAEKLPHLANADIDVRPVFGTGIPLELISSHRIGAAYGSRREVG